MNKKVRFFAAAICLTLCLAACTAKPETELNAASASTPARTEAPLSDFLLSAKELFGDSCLIIAKTVKLTGDVVLDDGAALVLSEDEAYTLDLNGRTLTAGLGRDGGAVISCTEGVLTIMDSKGDGAISFTPSAEGAALLSEGSGELIVTDIKIEVLAPEGAAPDSGAFAMYVKGGGKMTINGGTFTGGTSIAVENSQADLTIEGGSFSGFANLGDDAEIEAFLGERKRAASTTDGSILVS